MVSALAIAMSAGIVYAAVTVDGDGIGFVGKGDVQEAFNWNNSALQENAEDVFFFMEVEGDLVITCEKGNGERREFTPTAIYEVSAVVTHDARTNRQDQVTGFSLTGFGDLLIEGIDPLTFCGPSRTSPYNDYVKHELNEDPEVLGFYVDYEGNEEDPVLLVDFTS
jgi:hypothetical protein